MNNVRKILVRAECESCDYQFAYDVPITAVARQDYSFYDRDAQKRVSGSTYRYAGTPHDAVANFVHKCPKCGYIQSWMQEPAVKQRRAGAGFLPMFLAFLVAIPLANFGDSLPNSVMAGAGIFMLVSFIIGILGFAHLWDFLLKPNKNFPPVKNVRKPQYHV